MHHSSQLIKPLIAVVSAIALIVVMKTIVDGRFASAPDGKVAGGFDLAKAVGLTPAADKAKDSKPAAAPVAEAAKPETKAEAPKADAPKAEAKPADAKAEAPKAADKPAAAAAGFDAAAVVAAVAGASAENGAAVYKKCTACHVAKADGASTVGPNLWGIVGRKVAAREDFAAKYSDAIKAKGGDWGYAELAAFINGPAASMPGTKMSFPGIKDAKDVADLLAHLRTLADSPAPLPK